MLNCSAWYSPLSLTAAVGEAANRLKKHEGSSRSQASIDVVLDAADEFLVLGRSSLDSSLHVDGSEDGLGGLVGGVGSDVSVESSLV